MGYNVLNLGTPSSNLLEPVVWQGLAAAGVVRVLDADELRLGQVRVVTADLGGQQVQVEGPIRKVWQNARVNAT